MESDARPKYFVTNAGVPGVSPSDLQGAVGRAFATWQAVPTASISHTPSWAIRTRCPATRTACRRSASRVAPGSGSGPGRNELSHGFGDWRRCSESDIFFNSAFPWSVAASGEADHYDLESVALHEIGHLSGLGHSALGETEMVDGGLQVIATDAVMFPIAFPEGFLNRALHDDDVAGISELYPDNGVREPRPAACRAA